MKHPVLRVAAAACALSVAVPCAAAGKADTAASAARPAAARPALWRTYDMIVSLQNLPRTYTCDQLWYEFHGILLRLGSWPYSINILPYHCSPSPSGDLRSPDVQVHFQLPIFLHGVAIKVAPAQAIERTIRIAPGEPKTLHASDCDLMQQVSASLLTSIPGRVEHAHFDCSAPRRRSGNFSVSLSLPMAAKLPAVTITSAAAPR